MSKNLKMKDFGWVWEGQGFDPGVLPTIFGVGEGPDFFGISRAVYMFHPNTEFAMKKMSHLDEVICDIAKWDYIIVKSDDDLYGAQQVRNGTPERIIKEAKTVSNLSLKFPNVTGVLHDDMHGLLKKFGCTPESYGEIYDAVRSANKNLNLWACVYSQQCTPDQW